MDNSLRLGIRAHDVSFECFSELPENIRANGLCCTQLALKKAVKEFNVSNEAMTPGMAMWIRQLFAEQKVDIAVLGCYYNLATPDKKQLNNTYKTYEAHIRFASLLGCGMVGTETGAVNKEYKFEPANHTKEALSVFINNLRHVVDYAERMGVLVGIEPVYKHIMWNVESTRFVLDNIKSPNLRVILDPVNLMSANNFEQQDDIIIDAFNLLGDEIDCIHIKDFVLSDNEIKSRPVTFGEGLLNMRLLFEQVKKHKPYVNVLIEDSIPDNLMLSKSYIERVYSEV